MNRDAKVDFDALHAAIVGEIQAAFPSLATVEFYRADRKTLTVPAVLLEMTELEIEEFDPGTDQLPMVARFEAHILLAFDTADVKLEIRKLAASLAHFLRLRHWQGVKTGPAQVLGAYRDDFSPELDQFEVWRVEWTHIVHIGDSVWSGDGILPTIVYMGCDPDIGLGNEQNYTTIVDGGGFNMNDMPGLARWYDASLASSVETSGDSVVSWRDISEHDADASQIDAGYRYTYSIAAVNGLNAMTSDGSGGMDIENELALSTSGWCMIVAGNAGATVMVHGMSNINNYCGSFNSDGAGSIQSQDGFTSLVSSAPGCDDGSIHCFIFRAVDGTVSHFWDGELIGTGEFEFGNLVGGLTNYPGFRLNGTLCEVAAGVGVLTADDVAALTRYATIKWGTPAAPA